MFRRRPGISVLVPTQNEEFVVEPCIRSFLELGDEIIVVDNGSTDQTKDIVADLRKEYPSEIKFFDRPELPDLHHNRAFAHSRSRHRWVVRADSDYVCFTEGPYRVQALREHVLRRALGLRPRTVWVPQLNLVGDFFHTGRPYARAGGYRGNPERSYVPELRSAPMPRLYETFPGFGFVREGRRETTRWRGLSRRVDWPTPVWMHCTIKSDENYLYRSERTNWRELGQFDRFPTLHDYVMHVIPTKYQTDDVTEAAARYMAQHVLPFLEEYDEQRHPVPRLLLEHRQKHPCFQVSVRESGTERRFVGFERS